MFEYRLLVRPRAGVLNTLTERLVVRALTELRQRARLAIDLNRAALGLVFERRDHVAFVGTLQHALVPHPVEQHGSQVLGTRCGCVRCTATAPTLCAGRSLPTAAGPCAPAGSLLRTGCRCHADREDKGERGRRPTIPSAFATSAREASRPNSAASRSAPRTDLADKSTKLHGGPPSCGVSMPVRQDEVKALTSLDASTSSGGR